MPLYVPFDKNVKLGAFADFVNNKHGQVSKHLSADFEELINSKLGLFHITSGETFQSIIKKDKTQKVIGKKYTQIPKNMREEVYKKYLKEQEMANLQGREVNNNLDKLLSNLSSQQIVLTESRKKLEELNFKSIDSNFELMLEMSKSEVSKTFKLDTPTFVFQTGAM